MSKSTATKSVKQPPIQRLRRIAEIIEQVDNRADNRAMTGDGPVTPTLEEMTQSEISEIYKLASASNMGEDFAEPTAEQAKQHAGYDDLADEQARLPQREQPATVAEGSYAKVLHGTCALGYADCSLVEFARGLKYFIEEESHKPNGDTGLIQTLQRAACIGWELARRGSEPIVRPIAEVKK